DPPTDRRDPQRPALDPVAVHTVMFSPGHKPRRGDSRYVVTVSPRWLPGVMRCTLIDAMAPADYATQPVWRMRLLNLWWLAGYPISQTIGPIRHEGSHALLATVEGADVTTFVVYPQTDLGRFTWGYTEWTGSTSWVTTAAPYLCDLLWFVGFFFL